MLKKYLILLICLLVSALYFNILQFPNKIVTGGLAGISIIINNLFNVEPSNLILVLSVILLIIDYFIIGKVQASGALVATIFYPLLIKLTANINALSTNLLITSFLIGILSGISTGIVYKIGFSNGGIAIVSELISKLFNIRIAMSSFIINILIVLLGGFSLGIERIIYAVIILLINSTIIDIILRKKYFPNLYNKTTK